MKDIYHADELTDSVDRFSTALVKVVNDLLDVDAETDRVEFVATLDRSTLTIVVSWDPNAGPVREISPANDATEGPT